MTRALTLLNQAGDTTIAWTPDRDAEMKDLIEKKMRQGITFFIIEERGLRYPLSKASEAKNHRHLAISDADFAAFVSEGKAEAVKTPDAPVRKSRRSKDSTEIAKSHSVGVRPMAGG